MENKEQIIPMDYPEPIPTRIRRFVKELSGKYKVLSVSIPFRFWAKFRQELKKSDESTRNFIDKLTIYRDDWGGQKIQLKVEKKK